MRIIQVGIGGMGNFWLKTVQASPDVDYAGFVEINPDVTGQQIAAYGLDQNLIFPTLEDALAKLGAENVDGVLDVTPPQFHKQISLAALAAGIPVLSEKPLANTRGDAHDIVAAANTSGILHMVAQNYRYSAPLQTLKKTLETMGAIGAVRVDFFKGPHFGGFREQMPYPLIIDMGIHHFDLLRYLLGNEPVSFWGRSWNPSWSWYAGDASAQASFTFESGTTVTYNGSWCATGCETSWNGNWRFDCEQGVVMMEDNIVQMQRWTGVNGDNIYSPLEIVSPIAMEREKQAYLLHEFYLAVTKGIPPTTTCQDNIHSLDMVFDLLDAFESGEVLTKA